MSEILDRISIAFAKEIQEIQEYRKDHDIKIDHIEDHDIIWIESDKGEFLEKHHINLYSIYIQLINLYNSLSKEERHEMHQELVQKINSFLKTNFRKVDLSNTIFYFDPKSKIHIRKFVMKLFIYK